MKLEISKELFGDLWPFIECDTITDIKWNGTGLWINDLNKGRFQVKDAEGKPFTLAEDWLKIFCGQVANGVNENFNMSKPSLKAETETLRIQAEHGSVSASGKIALAIRKTPSVSRLHEQNLVKEGYTNSIVNSLLPWLMKARLSGVITGDVGSGKTELEKYLASFIPKEDGIITVEDTLEMKLEKLYPDKDIYAIKISEQFTSEMAIRDALRLMTKWLILSEARGREIKAVMEAASTGCAALTSIHAENVWEIPDRILNMAGEELRTGFENDVYTFFDFAIKVKAEIDEKGIHRSIDQICFFDRMNKVNTISIFLLNGRLTGRSLPENIAFKIATAGGTSVLKSIEKELEMIRRKEKFS